MLVSVLVIQSNIWDLNFQVFWGIRSICLVFSVGVLGFQESVWFFKVWVSDVGALSGTKKNLFALSLTFDFEEPAWFGKLGVPLVGFQVCGFLS